jgi:REP element-mobilizing transposase RayT
MPHDPQGASKPFNPVRGRRSIRLKGYDYSQPGAYFVTLCVRKGECTLGDVSNGEVVLSDLGQIAHGFWARVPTHFPNVSIDTFVVMPNHVHAIVVIHDPDRGEGGGRDAVTSPLRRPTLGQIVAYYKYQTTKQINQIRDTPGMPFWQRNYYEHIVRNDRALTAIRIYIAQNPHRWELDRDHPANTGDRR